ncbi:SRPBCC family protein [Streptomyces sp. MST-110588]|uniref:SRPBCC family protein n=1 Tax=Streptomyces sp. MST-110588 TaxID=2833628 RepID=UPI001F5D8FC9|nr:SRPBCC family protein [Streptomyces sp. MST-110588]UNO42903.1 SRPBCC family protein [Streptomyces sp. MST-110588]
MSEYERSRTMPALPEVVFDQACDLKRLDSWLPRDLHVKPDDPPAVTVHEDSTGEDAQALVRAEKDQMRMEWGTRADGRYAGWLQVAGIDSGASEVTVHLSFFEGSHAPEDSVIEKALDQSLERLAEQVRLHAESAG